MANTAKELGQESDALAKRIAERKAELARLEAASDHVPPASTADATAYRL